MAPTCQVAKLLVAALALAAYAVPSSAFCVYNNDIVDVSFFAWPVSPVSFKAVVSPGGNACCNFADDTCFSTTENDGTPDPLGQCAGVVFYITPRQPPLDATSAALAFDDADVTNFLAPLNRILQLNAPPASFSHVGDVLAAGPAFKLAGVDITATSQTGINFEADDQFVHAVNGGTVNWIRPNHIEVTTATGC